METVHYKQSTFMTVMYVITAAMGGVGCFAFGAVGIAIHDLWKWFFLAISCFCGFAAAYWVGLVVRPLRLAVSLDGLRLSGGWLRSPRDVLWGELDGPFGAFAVGKGNEVIGYNFSDGFRKGDRRSQYRREHFLPDATLPGVWKLTADEMAAELNSYRDRALRE